MAKIAIIYGSTTGNTESAASQIESLLSSHDVTVMEVSSADASTYADYTNIILGSSTWGLGDLQDDWECALADLKSADLSGKVVALFGTGDSSSYSDTFVDSIGILYEAVTEAGATVVGSCSKDDYSYSASRAEVDGVFVGLAVDDDSSDNDSRMAAWVDSISPEFK